MEIPKEVQDEMWDYCRLNSVTNVDQFILNMLKQGFNVEKYGTSPIVPQIIEKEIIKTVEKIVEVPVEKIIEKIIEVPIEVIIERVITDDAEVKKLLVRIETLESELAIEKSKTNSSELGKLYQKIQNLEGLLTIEKNRNVSKKEIENPFGDVQKDKINWVSKEKRDNLYGE